MSKANSAIVWEGPSQLDGAPIVVILSGLKNPSANRKTGPMLQTWILRRDMSPTDAAKSGDDSSICGECPLRHYKGGGCYVNIGQAPLAIWKAYAAGNLPRLDAIGGYSVTNGKAVRLGAYGDPAAVPFAVWLNLVWKSRTHTGYTHQWRDCDQRLSSLCMASCDTVADRMAATAMGWRYFGLATEIPDGPSDAIECLSDAKDIPCDKCGLCAGTSRPAKNILITPHGSRVKRAVATAMEN